MMSDVAERYQVLGEIIRQYADDGTEDGELHPRQLQQLHADLRIGGLSLNQVNAALTYCDCDTVGVYELSDVLRELDRRYFLVQDLRWEFSMLDRQQRDMITEAQAKWLVQVVHGLYFSSPLWDMFLKSRPIRGSGVSFAEIEVILCEVPSKVCFDEQRQEDEKAKQDKIQRQKDLEAAMAAERKKLQLERENTRKLREEEEKKNEAERLARLQQEEEKMIQDEIDGKRMQEEELRRREEERKTQEQNNAGVEAAAAEQAEAERKAKEEIRLAEQNQKAAKDAQTKAQAEEAVNAAKQKHKAHKEKRIRCDLKVAIKSRDKTKLTSTIAEFSKEKLADKDSDLAKAEKLLKELTAHDNLKKALSKREIEELEKAMNLVKKCGCESQLAVEMNAANKLLNRLRRLERIRSEILELKQATVAEIRSYSSPPAVVHSVMIVTFLLLGHKEKDTKDWKAVQALVGKTGKENLKRRCLECKPDKFNPSTTSRAKSLLEKYELDEVRDVSAGAATFFCWATTMIEEAEDITSQEEE